MLKMVKSSTIRSTESDQLKILRFIYYLEYQQFVTTIIFATAIIL